MANTNLTDNLIEFANNPDHECLGNLARGVATAFSCAGIPVAKRLSAILDLACDTLEMEVGLIAMWNGSVMVPKYFNSGQNSNTAQPLSDDLIERLNTAPDVVLDHGRKCSRRYIAAAVRFDGRLHGVLELRSIKQSDKALTSLEQALV